jgi:hypothetical protein
MATGMVTGMVTGMAMVITKTKDLSAKRPGGSDYFHRKFNINIK